MTISVQNELIKAAIAFIGVIKIIARDTATNIIRIDRFRSVLRRHKKVRNAAANPAGMAKPKATVITNGSKIALFKPIAYAVSVSGNEKYNTVMKRIAISKLPSSPSTINNHKELYLVVIILY